MDATQVIVLLCIGAFAGVVSSLMGVGGGIVVVPLLTLLYGMTQRTAVATSLAMLLPPIGVFAVLQYYNRGEVDLRVAGLLALPFAFGALFGAKYIAPALSDNTLRILFSALMIYAAANLLWKNQPRERAVLLALLATAAWLGAFYALRFLGKRYDRPRPSLAPPPPPAPPEP